MRELESDNLCNDQCILKRQSLVGLIDGAVQQTRANGGFVLFRDSIGGRLAPVLVDAILELNNSEVSDFERQRLVEEDGLEQRIEAARLLPLL